MTNAGMFLEVAFSLPPCAGIGVTVRSSVEFFPKVTAFPSLLLLKIGTGRTKLEIFRKV